MRMFILAVVASGVEAQTITRVTDAASFGPRIAPGALATVFGNRLANGPAEAPGAPWPTFLGDTKVLVNGNAAPLAYVSEEQINFQVPYALTAGTVTIQVQALTGTSNSFTATVVAQSPSIFQYGVNHAVAQNSDGSLNARNARAPSGSVITVYLTGQGSVDNPVPDGNQTPSSPLATATGQATATIGASNAPVRFLGLTPGFVGLAQANIEVPSLPQGDYPLIIKVGGYVSASALISVSGSDTFTNPLALVGWAGFRNSSKSSIALLGDTAYVCGANSIVMVDMVIPNDPRVVGAFGAAQLNGLGTICRINTSGTVPFLVVVVADLKGPQSSPASLAVYDLSNPRSPVLLTVAATQYPYIVSLSFSGPYGFASSSFFTYDLNNRAILGQDGSFVVFDFSSPSSPQQIGLLQPPTATLKPYSSVLNSTYALVAGSTATGSSTSGNGALTLLNIASITTPIAVANFPVTPAAILMSFAVSTNTLLLTGNTTGNRNPGSPDFGFTGNLTLTTMDISNPQGAQILASFDTRIQVNGTFYTSAFLNNMFAIVSNAPVSDFDGPASLGFVDARSPANPVLYPVQSEFGLSEVLATTGGYLLAPTLNGLNVYGLQL
jgi:uncharacterized protein (TIGR03437 family)